MGLASMQILSAYLKHPKYFPGSGSTNSEQHEGVESLPKLQSKTLLEVAGSISDPTENLVEFEEFSRAYLAYDCYV